jgi:hypothetical protein
VSVLAKAGIEIGENYRISRRANPAHVRPRAAALWDHIVCRESASLEQNARDAGADQRGDDEQPDLRKRQRVGASANKGRPERASGIHRCAGDIDAEQMDRDERESDGKSGKTDRRTALGDAEDADEEQEGRNDLKGERRP